MKILALLALAALPLGAGLEDPLIVRWNRFADAGNQFARKWGQGIFDARLARRMSADWRAVEQSGEWPK